MASETERPAWTEADERKLTLLRRNVRDRMVGDVAPKYLDAYLATFEDYVQRKALATPAPAAGTTDTVMAAADALALEVERTSRAPQTIAALAYYRESRAALSRHDGVPQP